MLRCVACLSFVVFRKVVVKCRYRRCVACCVALICFVSCCVVCVAFCFVCCGLCCARVVSCGVLLNCVVLRNVFVK